MHDHTHNTYLSTESKFELTQCTSSNSNQKKTQNKEIKMLS